MFVAGVGGKMALFLRQQGLPIVKICVVPQASQLPTSSCQEAEVQDHKGRGLPSYSSVTSCSHSEEPGVHHLPFIHVLLLSRGHEQRFQH